MVFFQRVPLAYFINCPCEGNEWLNGFIVSGDLKLLTFISQMVSFLLRKIGLMFSKKYSTYIKNPVRYWLEYWCGNFNSIYAD